MHLRLLSLCPRPAGLPAGQGVARDSRTHSVPVPALWTDGVPVSAACPAVPAAKDQLCRACKPTEPEKKIGFLLSLVPCLQRTKPLAVWKRKGKA